MAAQWSGSEGEIVNCWAYLVPGLPSEGDSARGENIVALHTLGRHFVLNKHDITNLILKNGKIQTFKTGNAVDIFVVGNNE